MSATVFQGLEKPTSESSAAPVVSAKNSLLASHDSQTEMMHHILAAAWMPSQPMLVDQWADGRIVLSRRTGSRMIGPLRLDRTPYMRGPLQAFTHFKRIVLVWSPQTGKTTVQQCILGYTIDQDPGPTMFVLPSKDSAKRRSSKHLIPMLEESPILAKHLSARSDDTQLFQYMLDCMTVNLGWAGSATMLASESIRYLICDESAKFKHLDKTEAHPLDLAEERTSSYDELGRVFHATTPTLEDAPGWRDLVKSTWHELYVPCLQCGQPDDLADVPLLVVDPARHQLPAAPNTSTPQPDAARAAQSAKAESATSAGIPGDAREPFTLADRLKAAGYFVQTWDTIRWDNTLPDIDAKAASARCVCPHCGHAHDHSSELQMTRRGIWVPKHPGRETAGFWMPSWYRGDVRKRSWNNAVKNFLLAAGDPERLQSHLNNDRCEPWREMGVRKNEDEILAHKRTYAPDTIPFVPLKIFLTVDIRAAEIHYVIRAWTEFETSAQLRYAVLPRMLRTRTDGPATGETLAALDPIRELTFPAPDGRRYGIDITDIDSGWDTDEVYAYCRTRANCIASKGSDTNLLQPISFSRPEKDPQTNEARMDSVVLVNFASGYFKDALFNKLVVTAGNPGEWMLHAETGRDLAHHLTAESKIEKKSKHRFSVFVWHNWHKENHWLDCETRQIVLARVANIRDLKLPEGTTQSGTTAAEQDELRASVIGRDTSDFTRRMHR